MQNNIVDLIRQLWPHLTLKYKRLYIALLGLMFLSSILDLLSIGSVVPLIAALQNENNLSDIQLFLPLLSDIDRVTFVISLSVIFCLLIIFSNIFRMLNLWVGTSLTYKLGADISSEMFRKVIEQDYEYHTQVNSSKLISTISSKASMLIHSLQMVLTIISTLVLTVILLIGLFIYEPITTIIVFTVITTFYLLVTKFAKREVVKNGEIVSKYTEFVMKILQESFSGIRDIIVDSSQLKYAHLYFDKESKLRAAQSRNHFYATLPKYAIESIGVVILVVLAAYITIDKDGFGSGITTIALLGLAAQRLLPLLQNTYHAYINLKGWHASIKDVFELLDLSSPKNLTDLEPVSFENNLELRNVTFSYGEASNNILRNASLNIKKGSVVGLIGETGSGKSTALDIIMSLLKPKAGSILIDGVEIKSINQASWRSLVAHVPQNINLIDASIISNIVLSSPSELIDLDRYKKVIQVCQLSDFIESLPLKGETIIGERGVRLSGGQRQRIGLARAIYKSSKFLILDEATSSLDMQTEEKLINAIHEYLHDITILMVAHRFASLKHCSVVYELVAGKFQKIDNGV